jgi:hypothetical protein
VPPPSPPSTPRSSLCRHLPPPVGRNTHQDSSSTNNALNNNSCSSPARRRTTTTATVATVVVAPPPPTLFKCSRVPRGLAPSNFTCVCRLCWQEPFPTVIHSRSGGPSRHPLHLCPSIVLRRRLQRHGPHGRARGINSHWLTPSTPWPRSLLRSPIGSPTPAPPTTPPWMLVT